MFLLAFISDVTFGITLQNGIISYTILFLSYIVSYFFFFRKVVIRRVILFDFVILNYIFWSLISILQVLFFNKSVFIYFKGISYCLFPTIGFFLFSFSKTAFDISIVIKYLKYYLYTTLFVIGVGIYFYFFSPPYYVDYVLGNYEGIITDSDLVFLARLLSYFGDPTVMGNISVIAIPVLVYLSKNKIQPFTSRLFNLFSFLLLLSGVILSFARSAWVACLVYLMYLVIINRRFVAIKIFSLFLLIAFIPALILNGTDNFNNPVLIELQKRLFSLGSSFEERNNQIEYGINIIKYRPFGVGLGQAGHKSYSASPAQGVFDNNYLRIFVETGLIGFISFLMIISFSVHMGVKKSTSGSVNKIRVLVLIISLIFYFQSIGSNILDLHYSSFLFWSFLGILAWTYKYDKFPAVNSI